MSFIPLKPGDGVGLTVCSDGMAPENAWQVDAICQMFTDFGLVPVRSPWLFRGKTPYSGTDAQRSQALEALYRDNSVKAIFDLSGGDLSNGVLNHLNFDCVREYPKPFFGYSDLSTILNAIYTATGLWGGLYCVRNVLREDGARQRADLERFLFGRSQALTDLNYRFIQGREMAGTIVGGNIRCFLKLAGTPFFPPLRGKILLLESMGGQMPQIAALLNQLRQTGAFHQVNGVLLGTFTQYEKTESVPITDLARSIIDNPYLPIAKTEDVGHGPDARCVMIGAQRYFPPQV